LETPDSMIVNGQIDTLNYWFWTIVNKNGCSTKVYYKGPFCLRCKLQGPEVFNPDVSATVLPNPNNGTFKFRIDGDVYGKLSVAIYNVFGQRIQERVLQKIYTTEDYSFQLDQLPPGIYFLQLTDYQERNWINRINIY